MSRVQFNTIALEWSDCMATCPKYNRALVPSFTDQAEMEELIKWLFDTTTDPSTETFYPDAVSYSIWLPFR